MSKRSRSSARWLAEHASDAYVQRAKAEGWRSRAVFKLEEIQGTDRLIRPGMTVVDLGAAPGGWSQFAAGVLNGNGRVIALDVLAENAGALENAKPRLNEDEHALAEHYLIQIRNLQSLFQFAQMTLEMLLARSDPPTPEELTASNTDK